MELPLAKENFNEKLRCMDNVVIDPKAPARLVRNMKGCFDRFLFL